MATKTYRRKLKVKLQMVINFQKGGTTTPVLCCAFHSCHAMDRKLEAISSPRGDEYIAHSGDTNDDLVSLIMQHRLVINVEIIFVAVL
jgi:hypothetical protein